MAWTTREYSKKQIDQAGDWFAKRITFQPPDGLEIINNWRSCHGYPLQIVKMTLLTRAKRIDEHAVIAQRTKRLSSIYTKLVDNPTMNLAQMQDIGGCRAILRRASDVDRLLKAYEKAHAKDPKTKIRPILHRTTDYIRNPKADGYRGIHLIIRYQTNSPDKRPFQGQQIEAQLRSDLQHIWATAVETAQIFTGQALKSKVKHANENWLRFFALMSSVFAMKESRPIVPGTSTDKAEITQELRQIQAQERIIENLEGWDAAVHHHEEISAGTSGMFLLSLDAVSRNLNIRHYDADRMKSAERDYLELEKATADDPQKNVVLVSVSSLHALHKAYPNYYVDSSKFIKEVRETLA